MYFFLTFEWKTFGRYSHHGIPCVQKNILWKINWKFMNLYFFAVWAEVLQILSRDFSAWLSKKNASSACLEENSGKILSKNFFLHFEQSENFLDFGQEIFGQSSRYCILGVKRNIMRKNFLGWWFFGTFSNFFKAFEEKFSAGYQNCILRVQRNIVREKRWISFQKLPYCGSKRFGHRAKCISQGCHNCILPVHGNIFWRKILKLYYKLKTILGFSLKNFTIMSKKLTTGFSKRHFSYPGKHQGVSIFEKIPC